MQTRPLQVYLDSSDYSRFADVVRGRGADEDELLLRQLVALRERGDAQFPISALHICEGAARDEDATAASKARIEVMLLLSKRQALRAWTELASFDYFSEVIDGETPDTKPVDRARFHARSDTGEWFPGLPELFSEIGEQLSLMHSDPTQLDDVKETLSGLSRQQRRMATKKLKSTSYKAGLQAHIRKTWTRTFEGMCEIFPVLPSQSNDWYRFVSSPSPDPGPAYRAFAAGLVDANSLAKFLRPGPDGANQKLTEWMRTGASALTSQVDKLAAFRSSIKTANLAALRAGLSETFRQSARNMEVGWLDREHQWLSSEVDQVARSLICAGFENLPQHNAVTAGQAKRFSSVVNRTAVFKSYFERAFSPFGEHRAKEKYSSDVGDIMHAQYIPFCDILRCDGFASTYLAKPANRFSTKLVVSPRRLPDAIDDQLRTRARATET